MVERVWGLRLFMTIADMYVAHYPIHWQSWSHLGAGAGFQLFGRHGRVQLGWVVGVGQGVGGGRGLLGQVVGQGVGGCGSLVQVVGQGVGGCGSRHRCVGRCEREGVIASNAELLNLWAALCAHGLFGVCWDRMCVQWPRHPKGVSRHGLWQQ